MLRRFDCVLAPVKQQMLDRYRQIEGRVENFGPILERLAGNGVKGLWMNHGPDVAAGPETVGARG